MRAVSVIGGASPPAGSLDDAREFGRLAASRGWSVVCGGLGGVMEAVCRGAKEGGGTTVGILPGTSAGDANPYVDIAIPTGMGVARNVLVVRTGMAAVAIDGAAGTLSEIALALNIGRPVILLNSIPVHKLPEFSHLEDSMIFPARTAAEAVKILERIIIGED